MSLITLEKVSKVFGKKEEKVEALKDVSLSLEEGEMVAVIGKSGSGKSTLLNVLSGLTQPSSGKYYFQGQELAAMKQSALNRFRGDNIGFVVQYFALLEDRNVYQNIALPLLHNKVSKKEIRKRILEVAEYLEIEDKLHSFPGELSGGQKQRVAIARALVKNSKIILADEPTGALDSKTAEKIMKLFRELNEQGKTFLIVTHDMEVAKQCDRTIELSDGKTGDSAFR